jgi:hypothetical protein
MQWVQAGTVGPMMTDGAFLGPAGVPAQRGPAEQPWPTIIMPVPRGELRLGVRASALGLGLPETQ